MEDLENCLEEESSKGTRRKEGETFEGEETQRMVEEEGYSFL